MKGIEVVFLSKEDVERVLSLRDMMEVTENVYAMHSRGEIYAPPKVSLSLQDRDRPGLHWINSMPAFLKSQNVVGMKWASVTSENRKRGLPVTMGVILVNDATTGLPLAVVDGTWITHMRTGAATAVAAKYLARRDAKKVAIIGTGAQGRTNLEALSLVFKFDEVRVVDIDPEARDRYIREMGEQLSLNIVPYPRVKDAIRGVDIVVLTTTSREKLLRADWFEEGYFLTTVSAFMDLDERSIQVADKFLLDDSKCALHRIQEVSGLVIPKEYVYADMGEVIIGKKKGREGPEEKILFTPVGMGAVDVAIASEAYQRALNSEVGRKVPLVESLYFV